MNVESGMYYKPEAGGGTGLPSPKLEGNGNGLNGGQHFEVGILPGQKVTVDIHAEQVVEGDEVPTSEFTNLSTKFTDLEEKVNTGFEELSNQLKSVKGEHTKLKKKIAEVSSEPSALGGEIGKLGETVFSHGEKIAHLEEHITLLRTDMSDFMTEIRSLLTSSTASPRSEDSPSTRSSGHIPQPIEKDMSEAPEPFVSGWGSPPRGSVDEEDVSAKTVVGSTRTETTEEVVEEARAEEPDTPVTIETDEGDDSTVVVEDPDSGETIEIGEYRHIPSDEEPSASSTEKRGLRQKAGTVFNRVGKFSRTLHRKGGELVNKADGFFDNIHQKGGKAVGKVDDFLDNLLPKGDKRDKYNLVDDPNAPIIEVGSSPRPRSEPSLLTPEEQEAYKRSAIDKFDAIYTDIFLRTEDKKKIKGERFVGAITPLTIGLATGLSGVPGVGAAAVGFSTMAVSAVRREKFGETSFDQFNRFSHIEGRPGERSHRFTQALQLAGRGFERSNLKWALGLNNFKGSKAVRELVSYMQEDDTLTIPDKVLSRQKKVDKLLTEATWFVNSTDAINKAGAYLTEKERQNIKENYDMVLKARDALLESYYPDAVRRSGFADRLYNNLSRREDQVFFAQVLGLSSIEALKTLAVGGLIDYGDSIATRSELRMRVEGIPNISRILRNDWDRFINWWETIMGQIPSVDMRQMFDNVARSTNVDFGGFFGGNWNINNANDLFGGWGDALYPFTRQDQCNYFAQLRRQVMNFVAK